MTLAEEKHAFSRRLKEAMRKARIDGSSATLRSSTSAQMTSIIKNTSAQPMAASTSSNLPNRLESRSTYFASTCLSCGPYCGLALMAAAQPISLAFSTYALLVAASKAMVWMPASACRLVSFWL